MIKKHLAFIILLFSSYIAQANCNYIDLRNQFDFLMRDQKKLSWCFAHASADNLQYTENTSIQISAADIAINYAKTDLSKIQNWLSGIVTEKGQDRPPEYGLAKFASQKILEQGYCPERVFPSSDWFKISSNGGAGKIEISEAVKQVFQLIDMKEKGQLSQIDQLPYYFRFKNIDEVKFFKLIQDSNRNSILENIRVQACLNERVPFKKNIQISMNIKSQQMFKKIDEYLDVKQSLSFDLYNQIFNNIDAPKKGLMDLHTVMVVGRKFDSSINQCRYLIKNSYSDSCTGYDPRLNCENGYLWFPESVLRNNITSAVFYKAQ